MTETQTVQVAEAKGRPMLHWVGKRPLEQVTAFPAQCVETYNPTGEGNPAQRIVLSGTWSPARTNALSQQQVSRCFVDESGDLILLNRRGQVIVGQQGCSRHFILGMIEAQDPARLTHDLKELRDVSICTR